MLAGFAQAKITPPIGTTMAGFGGRDREHGCTSIHDDLFVRACYIEHAGEPVLIVSYDLLFFTRDEGDRFKGAIGRHIDLLPRQILLNTSHTHCGPGLGSWSYQDYTHPPDKLYVADVERAGVAAAKQAVDAAREVTLWAGTTRTDLPVSRRYRNSRGHAEWRPAPGAEVYDKVPVCVLREATGGSAEPEKGRPICVFFSVACHPSTTGGFAISADYPGVATAALNEHFGGTVSMFLQGCGGDTKANVITDGAPDDTGLPTWRRGSWDDIEQAGRSVAKSVIEAVDHGLQGVEPSVSCRLYEMQWPLTPLPSRAELQAALQAPEEIRRLWAGRQLQRLDRGETLSPTASVLAHGVQLGRGLRLLGLEGEPVAGFARLIEDFYGDGVTFPLGYTNSQGFYLPTERMLPEGGYEVESWYEYGLPAGLAPGYEAILRRTLAEIRRQGTA